MSDPVKTEQPLKQARYTSTLGGSQLSVVKYGIVEFLRTHKLWRATVAFVGVSMGILFVASMAGLKIPGVSQINITVMFFLVCPELIWLATVSGPEFELTFPTKDASKERILAQEKFEETKAPEDALELDMKRLNEYYVINQTQARSSFRWAVFTMLLGFGTIIGGVWIFYFGKTPDAFMASLSTAAGIVVQFISGLFLYLHTKTQDRSLHYFQQLGRLQRVSIAIRLAEAHQEPEQKRDARNLLIKELLASSQLPTDATGKLAS
jgi:hypothetical protein